MSISDFTHVKLGVLLLKAFGLWPYQSKSTKQRNYCIFAIWTLLIFLPMAQCLMDTSDMNISKFCTIIISTTWIFGSFLLGTMLFLKPHGLIKLYERIIIDWESIDDPEELAIMEKFARQAQLSTFIYAGCAILAGTFFLICHYLPLTMSSDEEADRILGTYSKYFIIYNKLRRFQVVIHIILELYYGTLIYVAVMFVYISGVKHTSGMNAITSYKLRNLMTKSRDESMNNNDEFVIPELLKIVEKHRLAIKSARIVGQIFSTTYYVIQFGVLSCLAIMYFSSRFGITVNDTLFTLKVICLVGIFIQYVYFLNNGGEQIIGCSNEVFMSTYYMDWYLMSPKARKLLLMIILRSSKTEKLRAGTMTLSLEYLSSIIQVSWSLATVISSTQNKA